MRLKTTLLLLLLWSVPALAADPPGFVRRWGSNGSAPGQMRSPNGICIDSENNIYVADRGNDRIQKFDTGGNLIAVLGTTGAGTGQFLSPLDVDVDRDGQIYVSDYTGINVYTKDFVFVRQWSMGLRAGNHIELDPAQDFIYALSGAEILKYDIMGNLVHMWAFSYRADPGGISVGPSGTIYLTYGSTIRKYSSQGQFISEWGSFGNQPGQLLGAQAVGANQDETIFVADGSRLQQFTSMGEFQSIWGGNGTGDGEFYGPVDFAFDSSRNIYVLDQIPGQIQVFDNTSTATTNTSWGELKLLYK